MSRTLVVQQGHVARRKGATGTTGEQEFARLASLAIAAELKRRPGHDWTVRIIGADPTSDSLYRGSAFVALHCDGSTSATARGASVGYRNGDGRDLGARFVQAYERHGWSGGFRPANYTAALSGFYGTRKAVAQGNTAAVIVEAGFLTNRSGTEPTDRDLILGDDGPARVARAVVDAVLGVTTRPGTTHTPTPEPEDDDMAAAEVTEILSQLRAIRAEQAESAERDEAFAARLATVERSGEATAASLRQARSGLADVHEDVVSRPLLDAIQERIELALGKVETVTPKAVR